VNGGLLSGRRSSLPVGRLTYTTAYLHPSARDRLAKLRARLDAAPTLPPFDLPPLIASALVQIIRPRAAFRFQISPRWRRATPMIFVFLQRSTCFCTHCSGAKLPAPHGTVRCRRGRRTGRASRATGRPGRPGRHRRSRSRCHPPGRALLSDELRGEPARDEPDDDPYQHLRRRMGMSPCCRDPIHHRRDSSRATATICACGAVLPRYRCFGPRSSFLRS
jgi:hypothetical protein